MAKDWSNLKNQHKNVENKNVENNKETSEIEVKEEVIETNVDKNDIEKVEEKEDKEVETIVEDENEETYFVNSNIKNLSTIVGDFQNWVFKTSKESEKKIIRQTLDYQRWFIKELSKKEFDKIK